MLAFPCIGQKVHAHDLSSGKTTWEAWRIVIKGSSCKFMAKCRTQRAWRNRIDSSGQHKGMVYVHERGGNECYVKSGIIQGDGERPLPQPVPYCSWKYQQRNHYNRCRKRIPVFEHPHRKGQSFPPAMTGAVHFIVGMGGWESMFRSTSKWSVDILNAIIRLARTRRHGRECRPIRCSLSS